MAPGNNAVQVNNVDVSGQQAEIGITYQGSDVYFAVCAVMTTATLVFAGLAFTKPRTDRIFHYITAGVTMVAAIAYFTMGSHLGFAAIGVEFERGGDVAGTTREIYYVRYIDWVITTPLLLLDLMLTAAMPLPSILWIMLIDEVMIVTGLIGALISSSYKWGYYTFGCVALLPILYVLAFEARIKAGKISTEVGRVFLMCGSLTAFLWILYPIAWGVCEGGNVISSDGEAGFYSALDLLAKPGFGALLLWGHRNISPATLGLSIKEYGENEPMIREKHNTAAAGTNGTGVAATDAPATTTGNTAADTV